MNTQASGPTPKDQPSDAAAAALRRATGGGKPKAKKSTSQKRLPPTKDVTPNYSVRPWTTSWLKRAGSIPAPRRRS